MLGSNLPGIVTFKSPKRMALDSIQLGSMVFGAPIAIKSGTADAGHTGQTNVLRPGGVFVEETGGTGYFVPVDDWANAAKGTRAVITSDEAADADWASKTVLLYRDGVLMATVVLAAGDDSTSEVVTALNASGDFANQAVASGIDGAPVVITDRIGVGGLTVEMNLNTAWPKDKTTYSYGYAFNTQPDVRVIGESVCMVDSAGNAQAGHCSYNFKAGLFRGSHLIVGGVVVAALTDIPAFARAIFESRGSSFVL